MQMQVNEGAKKVRFLWVEEMENAWSSDRCFVEVAARLQSAVMKLAYVST